MSSTESETARDRILNAALRLLEGRENRATMAGIAGAAGISRQALYLHFPNRAGLLIATSRHLDAALDFDGRLAAGGAAAAGPERLDGFIAAWGACLPEIHGLARALMAMGESDAAARRAWDARLAAVRRGCAAAVAGLAAEGRLTPLLSEERATDLLWTLLSVEAWEKLIECGWGQAAYVRTMQALARKALMAEAD
jgi:AcrR family transcriptional regulator